MLNLAVGEVLKDCKDSLDTSFEITRLISFLPRETQHLNEFGLAIKMMTALLDSILFVIPNGLSVVMLLRIFWSINSHCVISGKSA